MSKNQPTVLGGQPSTPDFYISGDWRSVSVGDRSFKPFEAAFPSGEAAYMEALRVGQPTFCNFITSGVSPAEISRFQGHKVRAEALPHRDEWRITGESAPTFRPFAAFAVIHGQNRAFVQITPHEKSLIRAICAVRFACPA